MERYPGHNMPCSSPQFTLGSDHAESKGTLKMDQIAHAVRQPSEPVENAYPMMGNEAIARGVWEAGARVCAAYPGTPSTEILENVAKYPVEDLSAEWATNEKTALDIAIGGSFAGARSFVAMKHVGLNVASDSLMSQSYIGVNAGLVLAVADDPGIHSSQNEQDTRLFAKFAGVPILEPADAQEALDFTRTAFDLSEQFDTPVIVRSTTVLSHSRSIVRTGERTEVEAKAFVNDITKNVMIPTHARLQHSKVIARQGKVAAWLEHSGLVKKTMASTQYGSYHCGFGVELCAGSDARAIDTEAGVFVPAGHGCHG